MSTLHPELERIRHEVELAKQLQRRLARAACCLKIASATSTAVHALRSLDRHRPGWEDLGVVCIRCGGPMDSLVEELCPSCGRKDNLNT